MPLCDGLPCRAIGSGRVEGCERQNKAHVPFPEHTHKAQQSQWDVSTGREGGYGAFRRKTKLENIFFWQLRLIVNSRWLKSTFAWCMYTNKWPKSLFSGTFDLHFDLEDGTLYATKFHYDLDHVGYFRFYGPHFGFRHPFQRYITHTNRCSRFGATPVWYLLKVKALTLSTSQERTVCNQRLATVRDIGSRNDNAILLYELNAWRNLRSYILDQRAFETDD